MNKHRKYITISFIASSFLFMNACGNKDATKTNESVSVDPTVALTTAAETEIVEAIAPLGINSNVLPSIEGVTIDEGAEDIAPVNLTIGVINTVVADLQSRLMDLGYMESDEPTNYYGDATASAIKYFQRQSDLPIDGICGVNTWDLLMSEKAHRYNAHIGFEGKDIENIQYRLYSLGYLTNANEISGIFDQRTEDAVKKLQTINNLPVDGSVGIKTRALLYSDEIKANFLSLGEKSELVKTLQERLVSLGYLSGDADGSYGKSTLDAVKAFQSRNDIVVDGFLGPETRDILMSDAAKPFAMRIGEQSDSVRELQTLLAKYKYLNSSNITGYYGTITQNAVSNFQRQNKLTVDGKAGVNTMKLLRSGNAKKMPAPKKNNTHNNSNNTANNTANNNNKKPAQNDTVELPVSESTVSGSAQNLINIASSKIGSPYVWGSKGPSSFDCSGFVYWCLNRAGVGVSYMTSHGWRNPGRFKRISSFSNIQAGDIIVVRGHVGIAAGGGTVIDASSSNGRVIHRPLGRWWANNFIVAWRIFG